MISDLKKYLKKLENSLPFSPSKKNREKILKEISEVRSKIKKFTKN
jgi:hypothetical protein